MFNDAPQKVAPYLKMATSIPFLSLMLLHYGNLWGLFFLMTATPKFMSEVLKFDLAKAGILASLPPLTRLLFGFVFGQIGDTLRDKKIMSVTATRKFFCLFCKSSYLQLVTLNTEFVFLLPAHILPGLLLIGITYIGNHPYWCVAIITASLGFNGASTLTNLQNSQDLAPNYAGSLYSVINFIGTSSGFISPMVVAYFTQTRVCLYNSHSVMFLSLIHFFRFSLQNTIDEWSNVFIVGGVAYILPAILFILVGTGNIQKWNEPSVPSDAEMKPTPTPAQSTKPSDKQST